MISKAATLAILTPPALIAPWGALLLVILSAFAINGLGCWGAKWLQADAVAVYGGAHNVPSMQCPTLVVMVWWVPVAFWILRFDWDGVEVLLAWLAFVSLLGVLGLVDAQTGLLPNELTLVLLISGLIWQTMNAGSYLPPAAHCWGVVLGWLVPSLLNAWHERWRGLMVIGQGDARMLAGLGAWLGVGALPSVWLFACVGMLGYAVCQAVASWRWQSQLPFGPFLAAGGCAAMFGQQIGLSLLG